MHPRGTLFIRIRQAVLLFCLLGCHAGLVEARTLDEIRNSGKLFICTAGASEAFYRSNAEAFARYLGVTPHVKHLSDWDQQFQNEMGVVVKEGKYEARLLANGECDVFPNDLHMADWRQSKMLLIPYYKTSKLIVGYRDLRKTVKTESDLAGLKAAVQKGTSYEAWLLAWNASIVPRKPIAIVNAQTDECLKQVARHQADFTVIGAEGAFKWVSEDPDSLEILFPVGDFASVGWGVGKASTELANEIAAFFEANKRIGSELDRSWQRQYGISLMEYTYFQTSTEAVEAKNKTMVAWAVTFIIGLCSLMLMMWFWARRLKREIAKRNVIETSLRESESFSRAIVESSPDCIAMLNDRGEMIYISQGGLRLLEAEDARSLLDRPFPLFGHGSGSPGIETAMREAREGKVGRFQGSHATASGKPKWLDVSIVAMKDAHGAVDSYLVVSRDVTEQKLSADALRESEERFRRLVENAPEAIFVQTDGRFSYVNKACLNLYGADAPERLVGEPVFSRIHPDCHGLESERIHHKFEPGQAPQPVEQRHLRLDGTLMDVEISSVPVTWGSSKAALLFVRDISTRKRLEMLREDMDRITQHDLRSPLDGIIGIPQLLMENRNLTDKQREDLRMIRDSGYRILNMINLSLGLFRMEQGTYELSAVRVNMLQVVRTILQDLETPIKDKRVRFQVRAEGADGGEAEDCPALAEELLSYSMLSNLIKNALESSPADAQISISLRTGGCCRISISNLGEVPEEVRPRFFEKYATSGKRGGMGIGTYSAKLMARTMGGDVELDASERGATTLAVSLPGWK